jgi:hypothetical protein
MFWEFQTIISDTLSSTQRKNLNAPEQDENSPAAPGERAFF